MSSSVYHEDLDWLIRCCAAGYAIRFLPEPLEVYTVRPGSISDQAPLRRYADFLRVYLKHADAAGGDKLAALIGSVHYHAMRETLRTGRWADALRHAVSLGRNPSYVWGIVVPELLRRMMRRSSIKEKNAWRRSV